MGRVRVYAQVPPRLHGQKPHPVRAKHNDEKQFSKLDVRPSVVRTMVDNGAWQAHTSVFACMRPMSSPPVMMLRNHTQTAAPDPNAKHAGVARGRLRYYRVPPLALVSPASPAGAARACLSRCLLLLRLCA